MIDVQIEFLRPPDESGGYRMIDGIACSFFVCTRGIGVRTGISHVPTDFTKGLGEPCWNLTLRRCKHTGIFLRNKRGL